MEVRTEKQLKPFQRKASSSEGVNIDAIYAPSALQAFPGIPPSEAVIEPSEFC